MELSPSREAASCADTQELPCILWNPKVHYRVHKSSNWSLILRQISPARTTPSYLSKIQRNMYYPPTYVLVFLVVSSLNRHFYSKLCISNSRFLWSIVVCVVPVFRFCGMRMLAALSTFRSYLLAPSSGWK
jgi:hypothetical protein